MKSWKPKNASRESRYERQLSRVGDEIDRIVSAHYRPGNEWELYDALMAYSKRLVPWSVSVAEKVIGEVNAASFRSFLAHSRLMSKGMKKEIYGSVTGDLMRLEVLRQSELIQSIPIDAAKRIGELAVDAKATGVRSETLIEEVMKSGDVSKSHARMIARTEVSRASTELTAARAQNIGSPGYIWRNADRFARAGHRAMHGVFCSWDVDPVVDNGSPGKPRPIAHKPGGIWNCRCYPEVVFHDSRMAA